MKKPQLSVIIPVFNEEKTILKILNKVLIRKEVLEVIIVDDGSLDKSFELIKYLRNTKIILLHHERNKGKGAAVITGLKRARGEYVIVQDADLEYDPTDYRRLLEPLIKNRSDFVIGNRWRSRRGYWFTQIGNWLISKFTNLLFGTNYKDAYSGYKIGTKNVWEDLKLEAAGFEIEAEIVAKLAVLKKRVSEIHIKYEPRTYTQGKKINLIDMIKGIMKLLEIRLKTLNFTSGLKFFVLFLILCLASVYFIYNLRIVVPGGSIAVQTHWLDSVNTYLQTDVPLAAPDVDRVDPENADFNLKYVLGDKSYVPLEEVAGGDDQGYAAILSVVAKFLGYDQITYELFIKFNYFLLIVLGVSTSVLLFLSFRSLFLSTIFYIFYLFVIKTYAGEVYHHWLLGAYVPFYISFIIFFLLSGKKFKPFFWTLYFLIAGLAEIIRTGDGIVGAALVLITWTIVLAQSKFKIRVKNFLGKAVFVMVLVAIYILPSAILSGVRAWRDNKYFAGLHSNLPPRHLLWHHAFIGLGFTPNPYGIKFDENAHYRFLKQAAPSIRLYSHDEDGFVRDLYIDYFFDSPTFWFKNFWQKILVLHRLPEIWLGQSLFGLINYSLYVCLTLIFLLSRGNEVKRTIFWLLLAALFMTSLPALVVVPRYYYLKGYITAYFMTFFYFFVLVWIKITVRKPFSSVK